MRGIQRLFSVIVVLLLMLPDCLRAEEKKLFRIGVIVPLSGPSEGIGKAHQQAVSFLREVESELDSVVQIVYEDSHTSTADAIRAFRKLIEVEQVDAVYAVGARQLAELSSVAEENKIPFFAPEPDSSQGRGKQYTTLFRNDAAEFMRALWEQLRIEKKSKIALLKSDDPQMNVMAKALGDNTMEGESVAVRVDDVLGAKNLGKSLSALKRESFDGIGLFLLSSSFTEVLPEMANSGITLPLIGVGTLYEGGLITGKEKQLEGALMVAPYVTPEFRERFKVATGSEVGVEYAGTFYDFIWLLNQVVDEHEGSFENRLAFIKAMRFVDEKRGIAGPIAVKTTSKGATYFSLPIAVYRLVAGGPVVQRLFERPR